MLYLWCYVAVEESAALRRGSFGKTRYSTRLRTTRIRTRVYTPRTLWGGYGAPYRSWRGAGSAGYIYGYMYYTRTRYYRDYPDRGLSDGILWYIFFSEILTLFVSTLLNF